MNFKKMETKYIRTVEGDIIKAKGLENHGTSFWYLNTEKTTKDCNIYCSIDKKRIVKIADRLEDLADIFVMERFEQPVFSENVIELICKEDDDNSYPIYGSFYLLGKGLLHRIVLKEEGFELIENEKMPKLLKN